MIVREVQTATDLETIFQWWEEYNDTPPSSGILPPTGVMSDISAGFLIKTDTDLCIIEHLIVQKSFDGNRKQAMRIIIEALCVVAKKAGFKKIIGITDVKSVREAAMEAGLTVTPTNVFILGKDL